MIDNVILLSSVMLGLAVGGIAFTGRGFYAQGISLVERDLADRLRALRIEVRRLRLLLHAWVVAACIVFLALLMAFDFLVLAALAAALLLAGPWYLVARMARQRRQKIEDQFADAMVSFSSAVRAGLSIPQALEMLAQECPRPIRQEFQQIVGEYKLGRPLDKTLEEAKLRLRSENFVLFSAALLASRESGGELNETVERIAKSVLELQRLERKVRSETAQARKSAVYMAIIPAIILLVFSQIDPDNTSLLFTTFFGQLLLAAAILLNLVAYLWALKILNPDI